MGAVSDKEDVVRKKDLQVQTQANALIEPKSTSNDPYLKTSSAKNMFAPSGDYLTQSVADNKYENKSPLGDPYIQTSVADTKYAPCWKLYNFYFS